MYDIFQSPQNRPLLHKVLTSYGEAFDASDLASWWHDWGGQPPMTRQEAVSAIDTYQRAQSEERWLHRVPCGERKIIRDIVLVRRGVDLRNLYSVSEREVAIRTDCECECCDDDCIGNYESYDMTAEIIRMALEWE